MPVVSITRLHLRSPRFLPGFLWLALRSQGQARRADGCLASDVRALPGRVFWTRSLWRDEAALLAYMTAGGHGRAMPRLQHWCDEASVIRWRAEAADLPAWDEAERRMTEAGRLSRVRHPSAAHAAGRMGGL